MPPIMKLNTITCKTHGEGLALSVDQPAIQQCSGVQARLAGSSKVDPALEKTASCLPLTAKEAGVRGQLP